MLWMRIYISKWSSTITDSINYGDIPSQSHDTKCNAVSRGNVRQMIPESIWVKIWTRCQHILALGSYFEHTQQLSANSGYEGAMINRCFWEAVALGMGNLYFFNLWSEITALRCYYIVFSIAAQERRTRIFQHASKSNRLLSDSCISSSGGTL